MVYQTSEEYRKSLDSGYLDTDIEGTITTESGLVIPFSEKDIVPSSLSYDNKAVNDSDFCYGGVYVGEFSVDLMTSIDRYSLANAEITASYYQTTLDGKRQEIPLGVFYVYEATRTKKILSLKAFDAMTKFDVSVDEVTTGVMYDLLAYISEKCRVGLAQTEEEINAFINADWWLTLDPEHISTYREAISQICLMSARFATIDRNGNLVLRQFQTAKAVDSISARRRTESKIQDFRTRFCGVKARFLANTNFYPYTAIDETISQALILDLGDIPIFLGEDASKKSIMENLLAATTPIIYVPAEYSTISDPSVELGDCLELLDVNGTQDAVITLVHSFSWKYHAKQNLCGYGSDPRLAGIVSREEKILSQLEAQLASKDLVVKSYTNSKKIIVNDSKEQEIFLFNFASIASTTVMFMGTVPLEATLDGYVLFQTYLDGVLDENATIRQYVERGQHIISMTNYFPMKADGRATLKITIRAEYFESDSRIQDANIASVMQYAKAQDIEVDDKGIPHLTVSYVQQNINTTALTAVIKKYAIKGLLFAQGIAGAGQWDGTINVVESFAPVSINMMSPFGRISVGNFGEIVTATNLPMKSRTMIQTFTAVSITTKATVEPYTELTDFLQEEIPHREGDDILSAVRMDRRIMLGCMKLTISAETQDN